MAIEQSLAFSLPALRVRAMSRRVRVEAALEPPPVYGTGAILDVLVWGTVSRSRAPLAARVQDAERDLADIARAALPVDSDAAIGVEALPFERALFGAGAEGPDEIRLRFRIVATTSAVLKAWRGRLQDNLKALGVARDGAPGPAAALPVAA